MRKQALESPNWLAVAAACLTLSIGACDSESDPDSVLNPSGASGGGAAAGGPVITGVADSGSTPAPGPSQSAAPATSDASVPSASGTGSGPAKDAGAPAEAGAAAADGSTWCRAKAIFDKSCVACHDGKGSSGTPMGLTKYEDFLAAAPVSTGKKVFEAVAARMHDTTRPMPPKGMLPATDLAIVDAWIKAGTPSNGSQACVNNGVVEPVETPWPPPEGCDAIYKITSHGPGGIDAPFVVQPREETHPQVPWDAPWGNEKVQAIAFRPITDNKLVLHHWILYSNQGNSAIGGGGAFLTGWAPGDDERPPMPKDVGLEMPTGPGSLRLDMHYNSLTATKPENDRSGVEVCVVKGANLRKNPAAVTMSLAVFGFPLAPANKTNHEATAVCNVNARQPVHFMTAAPHAHKYAVRTRFTVKKKDGREIVMLDHPFIYGEQGSYGLAEDVVVETGDKITTTCVYTNTTNQNINFGPNTADEMCFNFAMYYPSGAFSCSGGLGGLFGN